MNKKLLYKEVFDYIDAITKDGCCIDVDCAWCEAIDKARNKFLGEVKNENNKDILLDK